MPPTLDELRERYSHDGMTTIILESERIINAWLPCVCGHIVANHVALINVTNAIDDTGSIPVLLNPNSQCRGVNRTTLVDGIEQGNPCACLRYETAPCQCGHDLEHHPEILVRLIDRPAKLHPWRQACERCRCKGYEANISIVQLNDVCGSKLRAGTTCLHPRSRHGPYARGEEATQCGECPCLAFTKEGANG